MELESVNAAAHIGSESGAHLHVKEPISNPIGLTNREEVVCVVRSKSHDFDVLSLKEASEDKPKSFQLQCHKATDLSQSILDEFLIDKVPEYLCSSAKKKVHVVVSTRSGTGLALDLYKAVLEPLFSRLGFQSVQESATTSDGQNPATLEGNHYALTVTQDAQSIREFARNLNQSIKKAGEPEIEHTVVLLSGDGGIMEMLNGKKPEDAACTGGTSVPLVAILPLGTGNALFHSLHKGIYGSHGSNQPSALVLGLRTLFKGQQAALPSFRASFSPGSHSIIYTKPGDQLSSGSEEHVEEHTHSVSHLYGAIVASYGFHAQLVWESDTPEYRKHGDKRFGMVAAELLKEGHVYNARVELTPADGSSPRQLERSKHTYVLATIVSNLEKTFTISPASQPLDGKLRLVHFGAVGGQKTMDIMMQAYNEGNHVGMQWTGEDGKVDKVGYDQIKEVKVTSLEENPRWRKVCVDGTIVEIPQGGSMVVRIEDAPHLQILVDASLRRV